MTKAVSIVYKCPHLFPTCKLKHHVSSTLFLFLLATQHNEAQHLLRYCPSVCPIVRPSVCHTHQSSLNASLLSPDYAILNVGIHPKQVHYRKVE